jgi:2-C-methyl-D-erythritol 2,4-cyclodiphosphate synthase
MDRVGIGYDLHRMVPGRPLMLGTVEVPYTFGLYGHSDGDALAHAIADALLGAAGLGEIGTLFPDTDRQWKGVRGVDLLAAVASRLRDAGWQIGNVDSTVIAERPRLAAHQQAMRDGLARALALPVDAVSVKIKSNEGCGSIGRGEAIAAQAIARIVRVEA